VYSNHAFLDMANLQWSVMARRKEPVSILVIDIDYFHLYKERYGKELADQCLVHVAKAIQGAVNRPNDFIGRFSKAGFLLMLPNTRHDGASMVAGRVSTAIEELTLENKTSPISGIVTSSIAGVCISSVASYTLQDCIGVLVEVLHELKEDCSVDVRLVQLD
jgi:diguanylate cyclase (GGDEF)-like protein